MSEQGGKFEVADHFELTGRGGFVIGRIVEGALRPGMLVSTGSNPAQLRIVGVEFLDNIAERQHRNALMFAEQPSLEFVKEAFPVGTVMEIK
jgi:hypothetical protein